MGAPVLASEDKPCQGQQSKVSQGRTGVRETMATLQVLLLGLLVAIVVGSPAPQHFGIKSAIGENPFSCPSCSRSPLIFT